MYNFIIGMMLLFILLPDMGFPEIYYVKPDGSDSSMGTSWKTAFRTITKATDVASSGSQIWVKHGTYKEGDTIEIAEGVSCYGGFEGTEMDLEQGVLSNFPTIVDGEGSHRCVRNYGIIDGFHIINGKTFFSGGGIENDSGTVFNCNIHSNSALENGGGIYNRGTVTNCNIYSNSADYGGGIYNSSGTITNCISWKNENGDITGNEENISFSCYGGAGEENGNIRQIPLFVNTSADPYTWDFHLQNGSPCIDAGTLEDAPETDIEGNPRPGGDGKVCMGAYESPDHYTPSPPLPPTRIYVSKKGNNTTGNSWEDAYTSITTALSSVTGDNLHEIWVEQGIYQEEDTIIIPGIVNLFGGFSGTESELSQRDIQHHLTIIDGNKSYSCVNNLGRIDGFHVTKGISAIGGIKNDSGTVINCNIYFNSGIGIYSVFGTVNNCTIYSNSAVNGGGIYNGNGTVINCTIYSNSAFDDGGGIYNCFGTVFNCNIYSNSSLWSGGGICNWSGTVSNCNIYSNSSLRYGGGISIFRGTVSNCNIYSNTSSDYGGGIYNSSGTITNCTIYSNTSSDHGGGIYNYSGTVINSVL